MIFKLIDRPPSKGIPFSPGRQFTLFLTGILALMLAACGGGGGEGDSLGGGGGGNVATCEEALINAGLDTDTMTPDDLALLPPACDFLDTPPLVGLFILGTEIDQDDNGALKIYVHGVNQDGSPMILDDFNNATVTLDGAVIDPANWLVESVADGSMLSIVTLADYSLSITENDVIGMGNLYDNVLISAPMRFEAETINFSTEPGASPTNPAITVKPDPPADHWTEDLFALQAANNFDDTQSRNNTALFDAMGTGLLGPLDSIDPLNDGLGLVERNGQGPLEENHRPATLLMVQSDGMDNDSQVLGLGDITGLLDRCHTTVIVLATFQTEQLDVNVLNAVAGARGEFVQALNTSFLQDVMRPYSESLGNLVVFTLSSDTGFANKTVRIEVDNLGRETAQPFDIYSGCQVPVL